MKHNERLEALNILVSLFSEKKPLSTLFLTHSNLSPLTKELCFGTCRYYFQLQGIALSFLKKKPKVIQIWLTILLGLYQLKFLKIPDYAAIQESVNLLSKQLSWAKGLVNAVLRNYQRSQNELSIQSLGLETHYNHPQWLIKQIKQDWPNHWEFILKNNDEHPPMSLRVNLNQQSLLNYLTLLKDNNIHGTQILNTKEGITLKEPCDVKQLPNFESGAVSIQDGAAQMAAHLLELKPHFSVLDACCAPGGKLCHILEIEPQLTSCLGIDVEEKRNERVLQNLERLHLSAKLITANALDVHSWWDGQLFDRILLDAPCTATGTIRRNPDIKILKTNQELVNITEIQAKLLKTIWPLLKPNGILLYATCSVLTAENDQQIANFIQCQSDCETLPIIQQWGHTTQYGWQILPGENTMDGFYYSKLKKNAVQ